MKKLLLTSFAICSVICISHAQNINTIAGNGIGGYSGNGGPATAAEVDDPNGMGIDALGNVYSATTSSNCITKISTSGIMTIVAGIGGTPGYYGDGGPATAAELDGPNSVYLDNYGNMYIAERFNNRIRKVNTSGIISTVAGDGTGAWGGDGGAATAAGLNDPSGVAIDTKGNMYIAEYGSAVVRMVNTLGIISTVAGEPNNPGYNGDGIAATSAQLDLDISVAVDTLGKLYIADISNYRIRSVNTSGIITTFAGNGTLGFYGDGGPATAAEVNRADYLFVDKTQNLYFGDYYNNRIRKVSTSGTITTIAGNGVQGFSGDGGPATAAEFYGPTQAVVSSSGNIFIDDELNNRIREVLVSTDGIENISTSGGISIFPNPANQTLFVQLDKGINSGTLTIHDIAGKTILTKSLSPSQNILSLDISNFSNGIYFVTLENEGKKYVSKFIKE